MSRDHISISRTESKHVRRQRTGRHYLTLRDIQTFVLLCQQAEIDPNVEVHIDRSGGEVPGDDAIWCRMSIPIEDDKP